jgi:hypothetical protein
MRKRSAELLSWLLALACAASASAHDGGFGHSRRAIFVAGEGEGVVLEYRILQNREDALVELTRIDANHDGRIDAEEKERYFSARGRQLAAGLEVRTAEGQAVPLRLERWGLEHSLVQVYRYTLKTPARELLLEDRNFPHKPGVVLIHAGAGVTVQLARPVDLNHAERVPLKIVRP